MLYHRITEAFKWAYGQRSNLGDPFDPEIADSVQELVMNLISEDFAIETFSKGTLINNVDSKRVKNSQSCSKRVKTWLKSKLKGPKWTHNESNMDLKIEKIWPKNGLKIDQKWT